MDRLTKIIFNVHPDMPTLNVEFSSYPGYKGLQSRLWLPEDECMVFDQGYDDFHSFWMGDVCFPLDIIFINDKLEVVDVIHYKLPDEKSSFTSKFAARYVVEANGGWCKQYGVQEGVFATFHGIWHPI